jgi:hypothetical protein
MIKSHPQRDPLAWLRLLLPCLMASFLAGCTATIWDQVDPEYNRLLGETQTDCHGGEVTGVWVARTPGRIGLPPMRFTLLFRPDGTGRVRRDGKDLGDFAWSYSGDGIWKGTPTKIYPGMLGSDQRFLPFTVQYADQSLLMDSPLQGGIYALGSVIQSRIVFVRADDDAASTRAVNKRF